MGEGPAPSRVLAQLFWGDCDAPDPVLGAGAGAEVWDALEKWEWARLYLHFTHITKKTRGPRAELGGSFVPKPPPGTRSNSLALGCPCAPGSSCWRAAQPPWWGSGLAEDPPDPQIFGFAKSLRRAGSGSGCRRSKVVPCVCVCVHIYKYKNIERRDIAEDPSSSSFLAFAGGGEQAEPPGWGCTWL